MKKILIGILTLVADVALAVLILWGTIRIATFLYNL
jgi:hypothetical protein